MLKISLKLWSSATIPHVGLDKDVWYNYPIVAVVWAFGLVVSWFILVGLSSCVMLWLPRPVFVLFLPFFLCTPLFHLFISPWVFKSVFYPLSLSVCLFCAFIFCVPRHVLPAFVACVLRLFWFVLRFALCSGISPVFFCFFFCQSFLPSFCFLHFGFMDYSFPSQLHLGLSPLFAIPCQMHQFLFWRVGCSHIQISLFLSSLCQIIRCNTL